ncbi:methyltransferase domain-containing protein [Arhodomonas sp. AD133]|uniref:methyltransferase domain-containing protein n=1 Tax=Arhodomonas sp. AD133 TaxID=3415009 RepID=UPI003EB6A3D5
MSRVDPFGRTDQLDEETLAVLAERFEARGRHPLFTTMLAEYLDAMDIDRAGSVLDMGCGTGVAGRAIARREAFTGHVTGVDLSAYLAAVADRLAHEEGLARRTTFGSGDTSDLAVADGTFDAVVAHTLLSHAGDPAAMVREAARVVRPGGMLAIFDGDYASLTFDHADPERAKVHDEVLISAVVTNPRIMRQMPRLLRAAGLELVAAFPHVLAEVGEADFWASAIEVYRQLLTESDAMTGDEAAAWAADLRRDSETGVFFGSSNYYAYVARRP